MFESLVRKEIQPIVYRRGFCNYSDICKSS